MSLFLKYHRERKKRMDILLVLILFGFGIVLIVKGGDTFVEAASWIAEVSGIPKLIVGATIVSVATTLPEMLVSVLAALSGKVDLSIGNAVGSVTANIGLIMAIAIFCMPGSAKRSDYLVKSVLMLAAAFLVVMCGMSGEVNLVISAVLLVIFAVFLCENIVSARRCVSSEADAETEQPNPGDWVRNLLRFLLGAAAVVLGARLLVDNGSTLARLAGISERVIGVTLVAVGTSLPELVTTLTTIIKKQSALSVGNILGANILDLTLILPLSALISGKALPVSTASAQFDLPICLVIGCIAILPAMLTERFQRWQGVLLLVVYLIYVVLTCTVFAA